MRPDFNLIDKEWIPCITLDGHRMKYGILDTLLKAHNLREIYDDSPLVTVALHRLLLAVLYRTHDGPNDFQAWANLCAHHTFSGESVTAYLNRWRDRFYLVADDTPFFQMGRLGMKKVVSVTRLATECASGNNATLFDHSSDEEEANWSPAQVARWLVACQSFALGFGKSGEARIEEKDETLPYSADAIALRGMNVWLQGETLFDTLMINLVPGDDSSQPPWEMDHPHENRDLVDGKKRKVVSSFGVVDRFTWQSRLVRLLPNGGAFSRMYFTQGRSADKSQGDPMKVYRASREEGVAPLPLSGNKAAWRDAHSIFMIPASNSKERRPECFNLVARSATAKVAPVAARFVVHVVGLASAPKKAGKFLLWRHDRMPLPTAILCNDTLIERLGALLEDAENVGSALNERTRRIAKLYLAPESESPDGRKPDKDEVTKLAEGLDPRPIYWARMEEHFFRLLEDLSGDWDAANDYWKPDDQQTATNTWRKHVREEARRALEESIRSLGMTARALQAVARVRTDFKDDDLMRQPQTAAKGKRKAKGGKKRR